MRRSGLDYTFQFNIYIYMQQTISKHITYVCLLTAYVLHLEYKSHGPLPTAPNAYGNSNLGLVLLR